jgi:hypothetical protein
VRGLAEFTRNKLVVIKRFIGQIQAIFGGILFPRFLQGLPRFRQFIALHTARANSHIAFAKRAKVT